MEVGDVAAWFAASVAIIAAVIAMSNANSAKTQAGAALKQAVEAQKAREAAEAQVQLGEALLNETRRANEITTLRHAREEAEREETAVAEARQVRGKPANMGGVSLAVTNHGSETIHDLEIESVEAVGCPHLKWRANPRTVPSRTKWETVRSGATRTFYIDFTDDAGEAYRAPSDQYYFTISYTTSSGRWRRTNDADPVRVEQPDGEGHAHQDAVKVISASDSNRAFQLLCVLTDRITSGTQINITALPSELGLSAATVQLDMHRLCESGYINVSKGDNKILSVWEVTARGLDAVDRGGF